MDMTRVSLKVKNPQRPDKIFEIESAAPVLFGEKGDSLLDPLKRQLYGATLRV